MNWELILKCDSSININDFKEIISITRESLEDDWSDLKENLRNLQLLMNTDDENHNYLSSDMSLPSSFVLKNVLNKIYGGKWTVIGGLEEYNSGIIDVNKIIHSHFWVMRKGVYIDITSDQYGYLPIVVINSDNDYYIPNNKNLYLKALYNNVRKNVEAWTNNTYKAIGV